MIRSIQTKEDTLAHSGSDDAGARDHLAEAFRGYLTRERDLARGTVDNYSHGAALFLARLPDPLVPLESRIRAVDLGFVAASGGSDVLIDEAAQDRFSSDSLGIEVGHGDAGHVVQAAGDALGDALVRLGCVVVRLVFGQDGAQMALCENQQAVGQLAAQGAGGRSQIAFIRRAWTAVRKILVPAAAAASRPTSRPTATTGLRFPVPPSASASAPARWPASR